MIKGGGTLETGNTKHDAEEGHEHMIPVGAKHRIIAGAKGMTLLEISLGDFDEDDIVRYEDKYGRA